MKYILTLLIAIPCLFYACTKKDETSPPRIEMTFKRNGIPDTFYIYSCLIMNDQIDPAKSNFSMDAGTEDSKRMLHITIEASNPFKAGSWETIKNASGFYPVTVHYYEERSLPAYNDFVIENAPGRPIANFRINISYLGEHLVTGTFTGNYLYEQVLGETIEIMDGKFTARNPF